MNVIIIQVLINICLYKSTMDGLVQVITDLNPVKLWSEIRFLTHAYENYG